MLLLPSTSLSRSKYVSVRAIHLRFTDNINNWFSEILESLDKFWQNMNNFHKPGENGEDNFDMAFQRYISSFSQQQTLVQEGTISILTIAVSFLLFILHCFYSSTSQLLSATYQNDLSCTRAGVWKAGQFDDFDTRTTQNTCLNEERRALNETHLISVRVCYGDKEKKQSTASIKMAVKC